MENKNIENNVQMDTYDKIFPEVGNGGLFSESGKPNQFVRTVRITYSKPAFNIR